MDVTKDLEVGSSSFDTEDKTFDITESPRRWAVLAIYASSTFLVSLNGFLFSPIASTFEDLYGVSNDEINLISIVALVAPFILLPVAMKFIDSRDTIEEAYYIGMSANMICSWIRFFVPAAGTTGYIVAIVTQAFISLTHPFLMILAPRVSAVYFKLEERNISTSLGTIANLLGLGLGMILSPIFIENVQYLFLLQASASTIPLVASFAVLDMSVFHCKCSHDEPEMEKTENETETQESEQPPRETFSQTTCRILKDFAFLRLLIMIGVCVGTVQTWITLINQAAQPSFSSAESTILIAASFFSCGILGAVLTGIICDKTGDHIVVGRWIISLALVAASVAMAGWYLNVALMVYIGLSFAGFFGFGLLPLTVELGVEYTFKPNMNGEATVSGFINFIMNVFSSFLIILSTPGNLFTNQTVSLFWEGLFIFSVIVFFTLPKRYARREHLHANTRS